VSLLARRSEPADELFDSYLQWLQASEEVHQAYRHWANAEPQARGPEYAVYRSAVDREEAAASIYSARAAELGAIAR
jgi:hypothetical protein